MEQGIELSKYWCPRKECKDYGKTGKGNIIIKEKYGKEERYLLKCRTCRHCFSETRGTAFFCLHATKDEVLRVVAMLPEKGSTRGLARATNHSQDTISNWIKVAGDHSREVNEYYLNDLNLERVQVDEIWSYIKKRMCLAPPKIARLISILANEGMSINNLSKIEKQYLQPKLL